MALISSIDDNIYVHDAMKYILTVKHYAVIKNVYKEFEKMSLVEYIIKKEGIQNYI